MDIFFNKEEFEDKINNYENEINIIDSKNNCFIEIKLNINNKLIFNCNNFKYGCLYVNNFIKFLEESYNNRNLCNNQYVIENKIDFPIKSDSDESLYLVSISENKLLNKIDFSCSCGLKFKIGYRKKCKHIKNTINQIKICYENYYKNDNISELISQLEIDT